MAQAALSTGFLVDCWYHSPSPFNSVRQAEETNSKLCHVFTSHCPGAPAAVSRWCVAVLEDLIVLFSNSLVAGIVVWDAWLGKELIVRAYLMSVVADYRAFPSITDQMSAPALHGACDQCNIDGVSLKPADARTLYPNHFRFPCCFTQSLTLKWMSFRFLPSSHLLRADVKDHLPRANRRMSPPLVRTHSQNVAAGEESEASHLSLSNQKHPSRSNGRKRVDLFSQLLPYWDR